MVRLKFGAIITEMKGSLGGTVFQGGHPSPIARNKALLPNSTASQGKLLRANIGAQKQIISALANAWRNISLVDQATWSAGAINFPFTDKFGNSYTASGYQVYMSLNTNLRLIGASTITVCPLPDVITDMGLLTFNWSTGPDTMEITPAVNPSGSELALIFAGWPQSQGRAFEKGRMKLLGNFTTGVGSGFDIKASYIGLYGSFPTAGRIFAQVVLVNNVNGQKGILRTVYADL